VWLGVALCRMRIADVEIFALLSGLGADVTVLRVRVADVEPFLLAVLHVFLERSRISHDRLSRAAVFLNRRRLGSPFGFAQTGYHPRMQHDPPERPPDEREQSPDESEMDDPAVPEQPDSDRAPDEEPDGRPDPGLEPE
jgi:hypothetical protein